MDFSGAKKLGSVDLDEQGVLLNPNVILKAPFKFTMILSSDATNLHATSVLLDLTYATGTEFTNGGFL